LLEVAPVVRRFVVKILGRNSDAEETSEVFDGDRLHNQSISKTQLLAFPLHLFSFCVRTYHFLCQK